MASGTINELDGLLKKTYFGDINEQMATGNAFMTRLYAYGRQYSVSGETPTFEVNYERSRGVGFRSSASVIPDLPTPGTGKHKQITASIPEYYGAEQFSERQLKSAKGNGTFAKVLVDKTDQLIRDFRDAMGISLYNPKSGAITYAAATPAVTQYTITVTDKVRLQEGNYVDLIDATDGAVLVSSLKVDSYDDETNIVTFSFGSATKGTGAVAVTTLVGSVLGIGADKAIAAGDFFVYEESYNLSYTGLEALVGSKDTVIHDIDRSAYPFYNPNITSLGVAAVLNASELRKMKNRIKIKSNQREGYTLDYTLMNLDEQAGFESTLEDSVNYDVMSGDVGANYATGYKVLKHDDLDIDSDRYATAKQAYLLSTHSITMLEMADTEFIDYDGKLFNRLQGKPAYEFGLLNYLELAVIHPRANGCIKNLEGLSDQ